MSGLLASDTVDADQRKRNAAGARKAMFAIKAPNSIASELVGRIAACFGSRAWGGPGKKHLKPPTVAPVRPITAPSPLHAGAKINLSIPGTSSCP